MEDQKNKNIEKMASLLGFLNLENVLTKAEFVKAFERVVAIVTKIVEQNAKKVSEMETSYKGIKEKMKKDCMGAIDEMESRVSYKLGQVKDGADGKDGRDGVDGVNPDPKEIVPMVVKEIKVPTPEEVAKEIPKDPIAIRDALESLQDEKRLDKSAIRGLKEEIENLKSMMISMKAGGAKGGFKKLKWIAETPSGDVNSVNVTFYLTTTPDPDNLLVMLNGIGQRNGSSYEYTLANKTITFNSAPPTGSQLFVWYSK